MAVWCNHGCCITTLMRVGLSSPLWREGDFVKFWSAATVSLVGDAVTRLALPLIAIVLLEATPFEVGVLGGAQFLPFLVVGLPAGAIIDRLARKRRLLVAADYARAAALLSVPAAYWLGVLTLEQLYAVALFSGLLAVFFDVTAASYLPALIRREHLVDGNSKLELSRSSAEIVGPGAAGLLIEIASAPVALIVDAVSFAASGTLLARLRRADVPVTAPPAGPRIRGLGREIVEGTRFVFAHEHLRTIALTTTTANFFRSSLIAVLLVYLVREADASAGAIGAAFAIGNIGFVAAALLAPRLARRFGVGPVMMVAVSAFGPAALLVAVAPLQLAVAAAGAMVLVDSFGIGLHGVNQVSVRQAVTPERLRGRMIATVRFLNFGTMPLGTMLGGALGSLVGLRPAIWVGTAGLFLAALPYALSSTHRLIELPGPPDEPAAEPVPAGASPA
jgi:MFS family permease